MTRDSKSDNSAPGGNGPAPSEPGSAGDRVDRSSLLSIGEAIEEIRREFPEVQHSTVRYLEREGLIHPVRTAGGHRLFRPEEIHRVLQIRRWQAQGLSLDDIRNRLVTWAPVVDTQSLAASIHELMASGRFDEARQRFFDADEAGVPMITLLGPVLGHTLTQVGHQWERGALQVSREKEVSNACRDLIAELSARHPPASRNGTHVVAAAIAGETHELGLRIICAMLNTMGYQVHVLGADVHVQHIAEAVAAWRPAAVLLSARIATHLPRLLETIDALRADGAQSVIVGGALASQHPEELRQRGAIPITSFDLNDVMSEVVAVLA